MHPDIAAMRRDRGPQGHAQSAIAAACEAWRAEPGADGLRRELDAFGEGAALEDCPVLDRMFTEAGEAERLIGQLVRHFSIALAANPLGHPPFRNGFDGRAASMLVARGGRAQLMLQSREPGDYEHPNRNFSHAIRHEAVLGGKASARIVRAVASGAEGTMRFSEEPITLEPGCRLAFDLANEALLVDRVERRLVLLRLLRSDAEPGPTREYCGTSGRLLHQSAGNLATSRQEAIVALLGRMGRTDAAPAMADVALGSGDPSLRWQALRECLALETATGFAALRTLAQRTGDPLAGPAGALRAQLVETYPQLLQLEGEQCPA